MAFETIRNKQMRQPGADITPGRLLTTDPTAVYDVNFVMPMDAADIFDPANGIDYAFEINETDTPATYRPWIGRLVNGQLVREQWRGGPGNVDKQGNPAPPNGSGQLTGAFWVRCNFAILNAVKVGLDIEIVAHPLAAAKPPV